MRLAFLGTPEFALPSLRGLHAVGHEIELVLSQPDRPRGRGQKLQPSPVRALAMELELPNRTLERGQRDEVYARLLALGLDAIIVVAFGHIIREPLLNGCPHGCINVHASLLPRWRGPAPIHRALVAGDSRTGVSIMRLEPGVDTGPVYLSRETEIGSDERGPELHERLAQIGADALVDTLGRIESEGLQPAAQSEEGACHAPLLSKEEGSVSFDASALAVHNRVRGLLPWPAVTVRHGDRRIKLLRGRVADETVDSKAEFGELLSVDASGVTIRCGQGAYVLEQLQPQAKGPMSAADYARGAGLEPGSRLESLPGFLERHP